MLKSRFVWLALAIAGCGGATAPPTASTTAPGRATPTAPAAARGGATPPAASRGGARAPLPRSSLCSRLRVTRVGRVGAVVEASGLALGASGTLWTHNDSGDAPRLFALDRRGRLLRDVAVLGAEAVDWEDIAARGRTLYVGDIGDNAATRGSVTIYELVEPTGTTATATRIDLRYENGPRDAEALLVDPRTGTLVVVTKEVSGAAGVYVAARDGVLYRRATVRLGLGAAVTAGDVSADGRTVVLRSYDRAFVFAKRRGESIVSALRRDPCSAGASLLREGQGESIALDRDGKAFFTLPEGTDAILRRYRAP